MNLKKRILIILLVYLIILIIGITSEYKLESQISPYVFANPTISVQTYLDDFIRIKINCDWREKNVTFIVLDEFNNIRHSSTSQLTCSGYKQLDLQGMPQDYPTDRKYQVIAYFDNETIKTGEFYFYEYNKLGLIQRELYSFFRFSIYENRLARGSYSDAQRLLFVNTGEIIYAQNYLKSHLGGLLYTFIILLTIDLIIWIIYFVHASLKKSGKNILN
jgi:hypothetical protein